MLFKPKKKHTHKEFLVRYTLFQKIEFLKSKKSESAKKTHINIMKETDCKNCETHPYTSDSESDDETEECDTCGETFSRVNGDYWGSCDGHYECGDCWETHKERCNLPRQDCGYKEDTACITYLPYIPSEAEWAEKTKQSILEHNPDMEVIKVMSKSPEGTKTSQRVMWGFMNKVLPEYIRSESTEGFYWVECGVKVMRNFDDWIDEYAPERPQDRVYWMGFTKLLSDYRVGTKIVFYPDKIARKIYEEKCKPIHMDRFLQKERFNAITSKTIKRNRTTLDGGGVIKLFKKPTAIGTKHHKYLYN